VHQSDKSGEVVVVVQAEKAAVEDSFLLMKFFPLSSHLARMLAVGNGISSFNLSLLFYFLNLVIILFCQTVNEILISNMRALRV
jgi:hypothetical protein